MASLVLAAPALAFESETLVVEPVVSEFEAMSVAHCLGEDARMAGWRDEAPEAGRERFLYRVTLRQFTCTIALIVAVRRDGAGVSLEWLGEAVEEQGAIMAAVGAVLA